MDEQLVKICLIGLVVVSLLGQVVTGTVFKLLSVLVVLASCAVVWYLGNTAKIRRLQEKIKAYRPGKWTVRDAGSSFEKPSKVKLGVFGVQHSGKSAFLNSLHFAYKGVWEQIYIESNTAGQGGETIFRDPAILTDQVTTFDTRGQLDLGYYKVRDVIDEITGKRAIDPRSSATGERIDCPIFILRYNPTTGIQHCHDFLSSLVKKIREDFGSYPIVVVTFADSILNQEEIVGDITRTGMEKNSLFFIENYTDSNHEMDFKKHVAFLKILEACIKRADDNITFHFRKEKESQPQGKFEMRLLRERIQDYIPGNWTMRDAGSSFEKPSKVKLGVFGVQDSGKSAFLNSLHFAYKGVWEQIYIESNTLGHGGETIFRDPAILTDQVTTFDTRGLSDMGYYKVRNVMDEITGNRGIDTRSWTAGERIDCPIFILKYNSATGIQHCREFISSLVPKIRQEFGSYPIMVVTFANSILNQEEIVGDITRAGMEKNSLFFIENYTALNHEMVSKKHIALLKILEACIKRADDNITFHFRKEKEPLPRGKCEIM